MPNRRDIQKELEIIRRGTVEILPEEELIRKLQGSRRLNSPLRIKAGFDPTSPDLHLGHVVLLQKLRQFQELGDEVIFLIGDFTAMIGDPSGVSETRKSLSREEVLQNARTYEGQVFKILDPERTEVVFNSSWMERMTPSEFVNLASKYTVARMLERDDFSQRFFNQKPIGIHEFLYPLLQGYDSVVLKADIEIGGTDQRFNLLVGRQLQREYDQEPQVVITMPLLEGLDGKNKMSKSFGNYIGIFEEPKEIFGKIMSISDDLMLRYYELVSSVSLEGLQGIKEDLEGGRKNPKEVKKRLAMEIVERFHSKEEASKACHEFERIFEKRKTPSEVEEIEIQCERDRVWLPHLITLSGFSQSHSAARTLIQQGGVDIDGKTVSEIDIELPAGKEYLLRVGKRRFKKIRIKGGQNG